MKPEIQSTADQLPTQIRRAENDLDSPKEKKSVRTRLSGREAGRVSGDVEVNATQPMILVYAAPHRKEKLSAQAKAFFVANIQVGETKSPESSLQIKIPICKHPGVRQAA